MLREEIHQILHQPMELDAAYLRASDLLDRSDLNSLPAFRMAVLRSFTIEPLVEVLKVKFFLEGFRLELFLSEFNQYPQEILDPKSRLYRFDPQLIFVAIRLEELAPSFFSGEEVLQKISNWMELLQQQANCPILLSNFLVPAVGAQGIYDTQTASGPISIVRALNAKLLELKQKISQLYLFDLDLLASRFGKELFLDPLMLQRMHNPYRLSLYPVYGETLLNHIRALLGRRRKCLVLDLDDTLWGGTLGEEGMEGIKLSDSYPGNCFKEFQRGILNLYHRGVILAVNSKNNPEEALQMLSSHPQMVLRPENFSVLKINWKDKVENLYDIARELNLGLEALAFMDDSPVECERVRQACPEVLVVPLPPEKHRYRGTLDDLGCFEQLFITPEDRVRGKLYQAQQERKALAAQANTLEEFYAGLKMRAVLHQNERSDIPRVAQMTQKTNQFNLTTRRYTETQIARFMEEGLVYSLQVEDSFGDNGIIALAIVLPNSKNGEWVIDSFLMSCRVVMRTIEDTLLAQIAEQAHQEGTAILKGEYIPTGRNGMVADFYPNHGFSLSTQDPSGKVEYRLNLGREMRPRPSPWITLQGAVESPR